MSTDRLNEAAARENALTLADVAGVSMSEAERALNVLTTITFDANDRVASKIAQETVALLSRTVQTTTGGGGRDGTVAELIIGSAPARTAGGAVYLTVTESQAVLSRTRWQGRDCADIPPVLHVLIACYATAATLRMALGSELPGPDRERMILRYGDLGIDFKRHLDRVDVGRAYLAGAGAVGNGLLWAARHLNLVGRIDVVDDDTVSEGNLNRQVWFCDKDLGLPKAHQLVANAKDHVGNLQLVARQRRIQDLPERSEDPWLRRLIVAVDSRRARRALQNEMPGEVFDASTTDIREVVVHYHKQPTSHACLSCVYPPDEEEYSLEGHIAEKLGVSLSEVREERISQASAAKIVDQHRQLNVESVVGVAYDTLFKQLCSAGELGDADARRVVAPFAFASVLAGTLLALELVRRLSCGHFEGYNYWRVNPWSPWDRRLQDFWVKKPSCSFCGNVALIAVNRDLWGA